MMSNERCLQVFLYAVKGDEPALRRALGGGSFDADDFYSFARKHAVAAYLYSVLKDARLLGSLPGELEDRLATVCDEQAAKTDRLLPEIHRLRDLYASAALDVIFLKGPFLSKRFYGSPERRSYGDIDLLVRDRRDLKRSHALLTEAGYTRRSVPLLGHRAAMRFVYHFEYRGEKAKIDLHWCLRSHFSYQIDYERVWATGETERLEGEFRVLSPEYVIVLLALSILGDYQKARVRLKFLLDLYMILGTVGDGADWEAFFGQRRRRGSLEDRRHGPGSDVEHSRLSPGVPETCIHLAATWRPGGACRAGRPKGVHRMVRQGPGQNAESHVDLPPARRWNGAIHGLASTHGAVQSGSFSVAHVR